jgi:hypothetical protein
MILLTIPLILVAAFMMLWAFNISFAAHLQEDGKKMARYHLWSAAVLLVSIALIVLSGWIL